MELSQRDREILEMLISDYIATAAPVGSGTIAKRYSKHLSPATVRNVMAELEDVGLLTHPHTSAGRVPTPAGLRYYVDTILKKRALSEEEMSSIEKQYGQLEKGVENVIKKTANILSAISNYAGIIVTPAAKKVPLKHIEFIKLSSNRLLGIVVTMTGDVQNRIIEVGEDLNYIELEKINNYCSRYFAGLTFDEAKNKIAKDLQNEQLKYDKFLSKALMCAGNVLQSKDDVEMYVEGEMRILSEPEFSDLGKARQVLEALEEKKHILHVIEQTMGADGVKIFIGKEIGITGVDECSLITASYKENGEPIGTLGVIGPMRMDYSKIISVVDFTSKLLSDILGG